MWKSDEKCLTSSCLHCILSLVLQISRIPTTEPPQKLTEEVDFECLRKFQGPRSFLCVIRCNSVVYEKVRKYSFSFCSVITADFKPTRINPLPQTTHRSAMPLHPRLYNAVSPIYTTSVRVSIFLTLSPHCRFPQQLSTNSSLLTPHICSYNIAQCPALSSVFLPLIPIGAHSAYGFFAFEPNGEDCG